MFFSQGMLFVRNKRIETLVVPVEKKSIVDVSKQTAKQSDLASDTKLKGE
jgi:hypothetical protein